MIKWVCGVIPLAVRIELTRDGLMTRVLENGINPNKDRKFTRNRESNAGLIVSFLC